jgi:hypothetical protein
MLTQSLICDQCGADLHGGGNVPAYRLCLSAQRISTGSGPVADVLAYPPIERDYHFCGLRCLAEWCRVKVGA